MVIELNMAGFAGSPIALRCALAAIKAERTIFATDYPQNFNHSDPETGKDLDGIGASSQEIHNLPLDQKIRSASAAAPRVY